MRRLLDTMQSKKILRNDFTDGTGEQANFTYYVFTYWNEIMSYISSLVKLDETQLT